MICSSLPLTIARLHRHLSTVGFLLFAIAVTIAVSFWLEEIVKSPSLKIAGEATMTSADLYAVLLQQALHQFEPPVPLQISLHLG
ncbi:hypothetical protein ACSBR2_041278 [Camellia fascicularis]